MNAPIRDLLRRHRGMTKEHRKRAIEWFLTLHEIPFEHALTLATPEPPSAPTPPEESGDTAHDPELYGTALTADEGLWNRTGWARRG